MLPAIAILLTKGDSVTDKATTKVVMNRIRSMVQPRAEYLLTSF